MPLEFGDHMLVYARSMGRYGKNRLAEYQNDISEPFASVQNNMPVCRLLLVVTATWAGPQQVRSAYSAQNYTEVFFQKQF